ncbi:MAG TPA: hypothetical protein VIU64_12380, partial [Polyangia bacterium]
MMRARSVLALAVALGGTGGVACRGGARPQARNQPGPIAVAPALPPSSVATGEPEDPPPRPLRRCFPDRPAWEEGAVADLLDRAGRLFDAEDFEGALACSEEAARQAPRSIEAHHDRAAALLHLGRMEEG